ncbi:MAG: hypothetical protein AAFQ43_04535 [Bacteroidota bacterium]
MAWTALPPEADVRLGPLARGFCPHEDRAIDFRSPGPECPERLVRRIHNRQRPGGARG